MFNLRAAPAADRCARLERDGQVDRDKQTASWIRRQPDTWRDMQIDGQRDGQRDRKVGGPSDISLSLSLTAAIEPLFTKWGDTKDSNLSQAAFSSVYLLSLVNPFLFFSWPPFTVPISIYCKPSKVIYFRLPSRPGLK